MSLPDKKGHFGIFGGQYVAETLMPALEELEKAYHEASQDPLFKKEIEDYGRGIKIVGKGNDYCSYKTKCTYPAEWDIDEIVNAAKKLV